MSNHSHVIEQPRQPPLIRHGLAWSASDKRVPCERSEPNTLSNKRSRWTPVNYWPTLIACAVWAQRTEHLHLTFLLERSLEQMFDGKLYNKSGQMSVHMSNKQTRWTLICFRVQHSASHPWLIQILPISAKFAIRCSIEQIRQSLQLQKISNKPH